MNLADKATNHIIWELKIEFYHTVSIVVQNITNIHNEGVFHSLKFRMPYL